MKENPKDFFDLVTGKELVFYGPKKAPRSYRIQKYKEDVLKGPRIIIDCDFEDVTTFKEGTSLAVQLAYCHNSNRKAKIPMGL